MSFISKIRKLYLNPRLSGSFSSVDTFIKNRKLEAEPRKKIEKALLQISSYYEHKFVRKKFKRRRVFVPFVNYQLQVDLVDVSRYKKANNNVTFLLVAIDAFLRFVRVFPLKNKTNKSVLFALKKF